MKSWRLWHFIGSVAIATVGIAVLGLFMGKLPPQVPIWYSRPWGETQLAQPGWLGVIPAATILVAVAGEVAGNKLNSDRVLSVMVYVSSVCVQTVMMLALIRVLILVV